jgi:DNA-binding MarR family transcriptional regulator
MKLTPFQRRALEFIHSNPGCSASDLAEHLKPDSKMHLKCSNQGHGGCRGKAAWLWGGSLAGKLRKMGLVRIDYGASGSRSRTAYYLTPEGVEAKRAD